MQESKWPPSQDPVPGYIALPHSSYGYRESPGTVPGEITAADIRSESGLMSMTQPETPRPETVSLPPTPLAEGNRSPASSDSGHSVPRPSLPARAASFAGMTTFPSHPYQIAGPIRKRRTESFFSFEMGPSFSPTKQLHDLYSLDQTNRYQVQLHAKMDRGFFRADQDWACYRRNYFQVSSTFDIHGIDYLLHCPEVPCLLQKSAQEILQVEYFSIGISACVSGNADKKIELVQHTPKRDKGPQMVPKPLPVRAGGNLHLASFGSSPSIVTFERMQFKTATANNGKRRAAQQYYEVVIDLFANTAQGETIRVATCHSAPLVVRGRSPGHYADSHTRYRHNVPTTPANVPLPPPPMPQEDSIMATPTDRNHVPPPPPPSQPARYLSLPTSPVSDLGPYSPYANYAYPMTTPYSPHGQPAPQQPNVQSYSEAQQQQQASYFHSRTASAEMNKPTDHSMMPPPSSQPFYGYSGKSSKEMDEKEYWHHPTAASSSSTTPVRASAPSSSFLCSPTGYPPAAYGAHPSYEDYANASPYSSDTSAIQAHHT